MPPRTVPGSAPGLVTIPDVELVRVGTWSTSTGVFDFTLDDFAAAAAAELDPEVWAAPVKIGHTDERFGGSADGAPAFGWVRNLSTGAPGTSRPNGDRLYGNLVDVPAGLAAIIPNAYPRCSVEMGFQVHTPSGARYRAAVVGLALLGVTPPAVAGLADVIDLYEGRKPFQVAAAVAARCSGGVAQFVVDPQWADARGTIAALAARAGLDGSVMLAAVDELAVMPPASSPNAATAADTLAPHVVPVPSSPFLGGPMPSTPLTDARVREILQLQESADADAALVALRDRAAAAMTPPAAPVPPVPGTGPFLPSAFTPPGAPPVPPGFVLTPVAAAPVPPAPAAPAVPPAPVAPPAGYTPPPGFVLTPAPAAPAVPPVAPPAPVAGVPVPPPAVPAASPVATAPAVPAAPPTPVAGDMVGQLAAAVAAHLAPQIAAASAPGMAVAEVMRVRDREAVLAAHARRGALRPTDLDFYRQSYDVNPGGVIAQLAAAPASFPTFELGVAAVPAEAEAATRESDRQFLASLGISD